MIGKCGIIFVHGIVGNNKIFDFLRPIVPHVFEIKCIDLRGHGENALAFSQASMLKWKAQVDEAVTEMSLTCDKIIGIGHSMGCLLLMEQAVKNKISGLFLLNPPLSLRLRASLFRNVINVAFGRTKNNPIAQAAKDAYGVSLDFNPLHYYGWPKRYVELFMTIRHVRKNIIPQIRIPVIAILSAQDEMVAPYSEKYFSFLQTVTTILLPTSTHYYYSDTDRNTICNEFTYFLNSQLTE